MEILFIIILVVIIFAVRANNKGKSNWIDTISIVLESFTDSTAESIGSSAITLSKISFDITREHPLDQYIAESVAVTNSFVILMLDKICRFAKNGDFKPYDIRNVASIILQHEYLCYKFYNAYSRTLNSINAQRCKGHTILVLNFDRFKDSVKLVSENFG